MNYKDCTKKFVFHLISWVKPLAISLMLIAFLRLTGLIGYVTYLGHWAKLNTGLSDAPSDNLTIEEDFDYKFTIKDLTGKTYSFDEFKGKVIFLNLWATWCGPCRAEMAGIQNLYKKIGAGKVEFVMLSIDKPSDQGKVVDYIQKKEFTFPTYTPSGFLPEQLRVRAIPTTFVISKEGKIIKKEIGSMRYDTAEFQKFLESLSH